MVSFLTLVFAGKVNLMGKFANVYCLIKADANNANRFYLHEVSDGKGNMLYQLDEGGNVKAEKYASSALQDPLAVTPQSAEKAYSVNSIPQNEPENKPDKLNDGQFSDPRICDPADLCSEQDSISDIIPARHCLPSVHVAS